MRKITQNLPAGLQGKDLEVFASGEGLFALYEGKTTEFDKLPAHILDIFRQAMIRDCNAIACLVRLNITDEAAMLRQYVWCNYGGFNQVPDYNSTRLNSEYWDCGCRGICLFEGKLCGALNADGETISKRELQIIKLIATGLADKEIAYNLGISYFTVTKHRQNIERKIKSRSKVDITVFAYRNNIVSPGNPE